MGTRLEGSHQWILVAEDDAEFAALISSAIRGKGYKVMQVGDSKEAVGKLSKQHFNCVVLDMRFGRGRGEDVIAFISRAKKGDFNFNTPIIVISGFLEPNVVKAIGTKVNAILVKPFSNDILLTKIEAAMARPTQRLALK